MLAVEIGWAFDCNRLSFEGGQVLVLEVYLMKVPTRNALFIVALSALTLGCEGLEVSNTAGESQNSESSEDGADDSQSEDPIETSSPAVNGDGDDGDTAHKKRRRHLPEARHAAEHHRPALAGVRQPGAGHPNHQGRRPVRKVHVPGAEAGRQGRAGGHAWEGRAARGGPSRGEVRRVEAARGHLGSCPVSSSRPTQN